MKEQIKHLGLRVPPDLWEQIREAAWARKMSVQVFCVEAIRTFIGSGGGRDAKAVINEIRSKKSQGGI